MTPTPDDIRKAREIVHATLIWTDLPDAIAQALRAEREAERERCAGKAEEEAARRSGSRARATSVLDGAVSEAGRDTALNIAAAIRSEP